MHVLAGLCPCKGSLEIFSLKPFSFWWSLASWATAEGLSLVLPMVTKPSHVTELASDPSEGFSEVAIGSLLWSTEEQLTKTRLPIGGATSTLRTHAKAAGDGRSGQE